MSTLVHFLNPKPLLGMWRVCVFALCLLLLSVFTRFHIYAGMLVGYVETRLQIPSLLILFPGSQTTMSYLSLRYDFPFPSSQHHGLTILAINTVYWIVLTILLYSLSKHNQKTTSWKTVFVSTLLAGTMIYLVGTAVLYLNFENILSNSVCCSLWH
jgi:hypothetical protein